MTSEALLRIAALCVLLASAETLHGIARTTLAVPRLGKDRATKWSALTGTVLAAALCAWWVPGVGLTGSAAHLLLGLVLAAFMAAFDIALGLGLLRKPWARVLQDFNPATGNYLLYGLMALSLLPWLVWLSR